MTTSNSRSAADDVFPPRNLPPDADPWGRAHDVRVRQLERGLETLERFTEAQNRNAAANSANIGEQLEAVNNAVSSLADVVAGLDSVVAGLDSVVAAMPVQAFSTGRNEGFGLTGSFVSRASSSVTVPPGKTRAQVMATGVGAVLDDITGGVTAAEGRLVISGTNSGVFPSSKDHGASKVNNIIVATFSREFSVSPGSSISVAFQMRGLNSNAFPSMPSNFAQVTATLLFT